MHALQLTASYEDLLANRDIDAVVLATPNSLHETQIREATAAGKRVYVEKPFTLTLASARAAVDAVARAKVTLAVGLNRRFHPNMIELTRRVREVYCVAANRGGPHGDDTTHLMLQFDSGVSGLIYCSVAATRNHRIAVYGTQGFAEVLKPRMDTFRFIPTVAGHASHLARIPEPEVIEAPGFNYVAKSLTEFARCINEGSAYPICAADVVHGVAVLEAAIQSAATKEPVQVTD